jgi:hypothetical protein
MSAYIQPVTPISVDSAAQNPVAGKTTPISSGDVIVVTDPTSSASEPVTIETPDSGDVEIGVATVDSNIIVKGTGTSAIVIGNVETSTGDPLDAAGSAIQIEDGYKGTVLVNLQSAITAGGLVDTKTITPEGTSIADNMPGKDIETNNTANAELAFYVKSGAANDNIEGSGGRDFLRLGAGDDRFDAAGGDDIVRLGAGDDEGFLGAGNDIVYLTVDQLQGSSVNILKDFDSIGDDKIQIDATLQPLVAINGVGTNAITITLSGAQTGTTAIVSEGEAFDQDDIQFV